MMTKGLRVFTIKECLEAIKKAERTTCIIFDELPDTLTMGKSTFNLESEKEFERLLKRNNPMR